VHVRHHGRRPSQPAIGRPQDEGIACAKLLADDVAGLSVGEKDVAESSLLDAAVLLDPRLPAVGSVQDDRRGRVTAALIPDDPARVLVQEVQPAQPALGDGQGQLDPRRILGLNRSSERQ